MLCPLPRWPRRWSCENLLHCDDANDGGGVEDLDDLDDLDDWREERLCDVCIVDTMWWRVSDCDCGVVKRHGWQGSKQWIKREARSEDETKALSGLQAPPCPAAPASRSQRSCSSHTAVTQQAEGINYLPTVTAYPC